MASTDPVLTFTITCQMNRRWAAQFFGMLETMQRLGSWGSSRDVTLHSDGDGDYRPVFKITGDDLPAPAEGLGPEKLFFDAG